MDVAKIVGLGAGVLSTIAFLPQVRHTWRTKSTKAISLRMFLTFCTGVLLSSYTVIPIWPRRGLGGACCRSGKYDDQTTLQGRHFIPEVF